MICEVFLSIYPTLSWTRRGQVWTKIFLQIVTPRKKFKKG